MSRPSLSWWECNEGWAPSLAQSWPSCTAGSPWGRGTGKPGTVLGVELREIVGRRNESNPEAVS